MQKVIHGIEFTLVFLLILLSIVMFNRINQVRLVGDLEDERFQYHVAVLTDESVSYGQSLFLQGVMAASEINDMVFEHYYVTDDTIDAQFEVVRLTEVNGVVLRLSNHSMYSKQIKKLRESGIFVVLIGNDAPETDRNMYLGSNKYQQGKDAAHLAIEAMGEDGNIVLIAGSEYSGDQSASLKHFSSGIYDALQKFPANQLTGLYFSKEFRAELIVDELLSQERNVKALICTDPIDVTRVIRVLVDRNAVGDIKIISSGITPEIEEFIDKKIIYASIVEDHQAIGELAIEHLKALFLSEWGSTYVNVPYEIVK